MEKFHTKTFDAKISDLKPSSKNPRQISKKDFDLLKKSLEDFPEMRSIREIVIDEDFNILGGHQRIKALKELGEDTVPVKQVFGLTEQQKDEFIIKDNKDSGRWDFDVMMDNWDADLLMSWGVGQEKDFKDPKIMGDELMEVDIPVYEPSAKKPTIDALAKKDRFAELVTRIDNSNAPDELKDLMRIRASFFTEFNFQKLADYYANESDPKVKELFKALGFVIITPPEAIKLGIAKLSKRIMKRYAELQDVGPVDSEEEQE